MQHTVGIWDTRKARTQTNTSHSHMCEQRGHRREQMALGAGGSEPIHMCEQRGHRREQMALGAGGFEPTHMCEQRGQRREQMALGVGRSEPTHMCEQRGQHCGQNGLGAALRLPLFACSSNASRALGSLSAFFIGLFAPLAAHSEPVVQRTCSAF